MTVTGTSNLPVAPRNTPWNAPAAKRRILESCGDNVACIGRGFLWRDAGDARSPEVWQLGFADVIGGVLHIVPAGIAACAGARGIGSFSLDDKESERVKARITTIYQRVRRENEDWPETPFGPLTADATGTPIAGVIAVEGQDTGDGRRIEPDALTWDEGPWPLVFDQQEMDHTGATVGTINAIERRDEGIIWATGNLSDSQDPTTQMMVARAAELFSEGAVGVSVSLDDAVTHDEDGIEVWTSGRIRSVAIVDEAAFSPAKMSLAASLGPVRPEWFANPRFGDESDERLVWQEPERSEEVRQLGAPLQITDEGRIYGHAALWGRCHVGYPGTCVRPPKEPAAYRGFLTGERIPGIPTGPLVMRTTHASLKLSADAAQAHYDHSGYAVGDVAVGPDKLGMWVAGAIRRDASESDIDMLRGSALSGDWRVIGGQMRLVGLLVVSAPGFRVARAMAASGAMITTGPGCSLCDDDEPSIEDRVAVLERMIADSLLAGLDSTA